MKKEVNSWNLHSSMISVPNDTFVLEFRSLDVLR